MVDPLRNNRINEQEGQVDQRTSAEPVNPTDQQITSAGRKSKKK